MPTVDFKAIREAVSFEQVAPFLGIELQREKDHYRCFCPRCQKDRVLILNPGRKIYYCHNEKKGGDICDLTAHIRGIRQIEAAKLLADTFMRPQEPEKPKRRRSAKPKTPAAFDVVSEETEQWQAFIARL